MPITQIVIFGASGDLTARKLIPALVGNARAGSLEGEIQVIGVSRSSRTSEAWRDELARWLPDSDLPVWRALAPHVHYIAGSVLSADFLAGLSAKLDDLAAGENPGRLFYLALKPTLFAPVVEGLSAAGMIQCPPGAEEGWRRVVVEKPFGTDLQTAMALNRVLLSHLREDQIFRIDHYLGKETVQNILAFRFQNAIFEPLWSREHVESVEISVCEEVGMEGGRGGYYDTAGALRDMVQNHVLQVLALIAMEPPASMAADAVRSEKVKVLSSLRIPSPAEVARDVVRGQYLASEARVSGYLQEQGVPDGSDTETYVAIRAGIDNWRWSGVPFFLRTGKCMHQRYTEVILNFRVPPVDLLNGPVQGAACAMRPNSLHLLIQPHEQIRLGFLVKQPGPGTMMRPAMLKFDYRDIQTEPTAPAYQRLLLDAIEGNATLFIRGDETEAAWRFADAIREGWQAPGADPIHGYHAGSMGPAAADALFRGCEGTWGRGS
ncbi:MAG: glucose-6-phosphate dehydrogenase [Myxococcota bacterium]|nr:glucose-6-phosphate dehydrogenase [Myxococcota bacterium]